MKPAIDDKCRALVERRKVLKLEHSVQHYYYFRLTMTLVRGDKNLTIMEQLNDSYIDLTKKYKEQQRRVINEMVAISSGYTEPMTHLGRELCTGETTAMTVMDSILVRILLIVRWMESPLSWLRWWRPTASCPRPLPPHLC